MQTLANELAELRRDLDLIQQGQLRHCRNHADVTQAEAVILQREIQSLEKTIARRDALLREAGPIRRISAHSSLRNY